MNTGTLLIILTTIFPSSPTSLQPLLYRPSPCPPDLHLLSPFLHLILLPTCPPPPPTQPVTSEEEEEEEELFTCPGTGTFPTTQNCDTFYVCSVPGEVLKDVWKCPRGTRFSEDLGVCDFQRNV